LFRRADGLGRWDLVVSAPWLERGKYKALAELVDLLSKSIGRTPFVELARVETIPRKNATLKSILTDFPVDDREHERRLRCNELFGLEMEEAIILRAKRPSPNKPARRVLQPVGAGSSSGRD
jgi:hypothetical protein